MNTTKITPPENKFKRLDYIDFAKAFGMLLIVWGHIRLGDWSNAFVYAFHIPLFFFLSGMVFSKKRYPDFKSFLLKRVNSLIKPYIVFSVLTWIVWAAFSYVTHANVDSYWMPLAETFIAQGSGGFLLHNVPLWFVTCLFIVEIIYYFLADLKRLWIMTITIVMAAISYWAINNLECFDITLLPWNIEVAMLAIPFYAAGHWIVKAKTHQGIMNMVNSYKITTIVLAAVFAYVVYVGSQYNGSISFGHADLGKNVFVTYGCGLAGTLMCLIGCILLADTKINKAGLKLLEWTKWFGRNSFNAMAIHNPIKGFVCMVAGVALHCGSAAVSANSYYSFIAFLLTLVVTVIGMVFINWFKSKISRKEK